MWNLSLLNCGSRSHLLVFSRAEIKFSSRVSSAYSLPASIAPRLDGKMPSMYGILSSRMS